jgi:hypothetical protein
LKLWNAFNLLKAKNILIILDLLYKYFIRLIFCSRSDSTIDVKLKDLKALLGASYTFFQVDALFYQGSFRESLQVLRQMDIPGSTGSKKCKKRKPQ